MADQEFNNHQDEMMAAPERGGLWPWSGAGDAVAQLQHSGIVLRAAEPRDAEGLAALANLPLFRAGTMRQPFQSEEATRRWLSDSASAKVDLIAEAAGMIVGSAGLRCSSGRRQHVALLALGVHDAYQRRGIGQALLEAVLDTGFNWMQLLRIELQVFADNAGAIALYEKMGFVTEGRHRAAGFRNGLHVDILSMALLVPALQTTSKSPNRPAA